MALCTLTSEETLTSPPATDSLPTLPFDLVVEILYWLPVKFLLQFRSVCKLWNSLISDLKFAKKHLHLSATHSLNYICYFGSLSSYSFESRPLDSLFSTISLDVTQIEYPPKGFDRGFHPDHTYYIVGSCNGILFLARSHDSYVVVWNPSIRKFKELPPLEKLKYHRPCRRMSRGFGYDHVNDNYKVVTVLMYPRYRRRGICSISKTGVMIYTFGTDSWKSIGEFPFGCVPFGPSGTSVSGTINWLASKSWHRKTPCLIVSFNLNNESFQEILQPDHGEVDAYRLSLGVLRNCLSMTCGYDVWLMKEYGNKESWTKLLTISYGQNLSNSYSRSKAICMFGDDQVLLESFLNGDEKLIVYDLKTCTFKFTNFQYKNPRYCREWILDVCIESLILP